MKKRVVKVLGFFVLNILFFTILLGFVSQPDKAVHVTPSNTIPQQPVTGEAAQNAFKNTSQKLVTTTVAEVAIN